MRTVMIHITWIFQLVYSDSRLKKFPLKSKNKNIARDSDSWKRNTRKQKRISGEKYMSKQNKLIAETSLGLRCADIWRYKYTNTISQVERKNIFKHLW